MERDENVSIFNFKRPPILLMGSGITRRYCKNAPCWEDLLYRVGSRIGLTAADFVPLKNDAKRNCGKTGVMPRLATEMQIELDKKLRSGTIKIDDILTDCELIEYLRHKADAVKIMAAFECMKIKVDVSGALRDELIYLCKLPEIVPCVVTTNYDTLIEDGLFEGKFKVGGI